MAESISEMTELSENILCKICCKRKGIYVCPRCNILYCSLTCYQSEAHSNCSEGFYRDCVMEEIKTRAKDPVSEKKMFEILRKLQENAEEESKFDSDDDDSLPDLQERLGNVNLEDADCVWEKLTPAERREFEELLQSGDASELVSPWEPWWFYRKQKTMVQDMTTEEKALPPPYIANCPPNMKCILPLCQISKSAPAACVKNNVINVLGAYCYTTRFFNGEHHNTFSEACSVLANLSANLSLNHSYDSPIIAIEGVAHEVMHNNWLEGSHESVACMKNDVECILTGPEESNPFFYLSAALSDIHQLFLEAKQNKHYGVEKKKGEFSKRFTENSPTSIIPKDKLKLIIKKLEYYLSWAQNYASEICCHNLRF